MLQFFDGVHVSKTLAGYACIEQERSDDADHAKDLFTER